jgi:hypothetical protein
MWVRPSSRSGPGRRAGEERIVRSIALEVTSGCTSEPALMELTPRAERSAPIRLSRLEQSDLVAAA